MATLDWHVKSEVSPTPQLCGEIGDGQNQGTERKKQPRLHVTYSIPSPKQSHMPVTMGE
jgi:hypothetical protein